LRIGFNKLQSAHLNLTYTPPSIRDVILFPALKKEE
jgi:hypothetical protein